MWADVTVREWTSSVGTGYLIIAISFCGVVFIGLLVVSSYRMHQMNHKNCLWENECRDYIVIIMSITSACVTVVVTSMWDSIRHLVIESVWGWWIVLIVIGVITSHDGVHVRSWVVSMCVNGALVFTFSTWLWVWSLTDPSDVLWIAFAYSTMASYTLYDASTIIGARRYRVPMRWCMFRVAGHWWVMIASYIQERLPQGWFS